VLKEIVTVPEVPPPVKPVPAVTPSMSPGSEIEPPRDTAVPFIVIALFVSDAFAMLESVLVEPLIVLFVKVSVDEAVTPFRTAIEFQAVVPSPILNLPVSVS
jgi:hypothetical protein